MTELIFHPKEEERIHILVKSGSYIAAHIIIGNRLNLSKLDAKIWFEKWLKKHNYIQKNELIRIK